jgi:putative ABC transport system permease protein
MTGPSWFDSLVQDVRYGARILRLNPGFTLVAVLSLTLGIGANTAIFQLIDAVRLNTIPVPHPQQLATVRIADRGWSSGRFEGRYSQLTFPLWEQIRDHQEGFSSMFAWAAQQFNLASGGEARYAQGIWVSGKFFETLQVPALVGRTLTVADDQRGCGGPPAVLSYSFWQREFGGKPDVLGQTLRLEGHPFEIVGVTPAYFYGVEVGHAFDVAVPVCSEPLIRGEESLTDKRHGWWLASMGRLKPGWTLEQANAQISSVSAGMLEATIPPGYSPESAKHYMEYKFGAFSAATGFSNLRRTYQDPLWILMAIAGFVLLIACANIANLMLARASAREREITVRLTLGASRGRLIRQLLSESVLLALGGAVLGAVLAQGLSRFLVASIQTQGSEMFLDLSLDWRILSFTGGVAVLTVLFFGLVPALRATRVSPACVLKAAGRGMTAGRERFGLRRMLVVCQVAFSLVLVFGAVLFARSLAKLLATDAGFRQTGILEMDVDFTKLGIATDQREPYRAALVDRLRALPGVEGVAHTSIVPMSGSGWNEGIVLAGQTERASETPQFSRITPGYFSTMGVPMLAGRDFDRRDTASSPRVAIVNEAFVKKVLKGANAMGLRFQIEEYVGRDRPMYEVVGLVKDTKYYDLRDEFSPIVYLASMQDDHPDQYAQILIRSQLPLGSLTASVKSAMTAASPMLTIEFHNMETMIQNSMVRDRLMATLSGFFGALAALLAMIGLYGVISYSVAQRTNEIGVRMALGAQRLDILGMILREVGWMLLAGLAVGTGLALGLGRSAGALLFGIKPHDPLTISISALGLAAVAILASYVPARRAARLDPMSALRDE